jgi:protein-L-isoaspartate(D-aspartate) O-methyltransferase
MTQALQPFPGAKALEIGTGSGYQTAIMAQLCKYVVSLERRPLLAERARLRLSALHYTNIEIHEADGTLGWAAEANYDRIMVTAGSPRVPEALIEQLAEGGRMVIPVGSLRLQSLRLVEKNNNGQVQIRDLGSCRFVPLVGEGAWQEGVDDAEYWGF